MESLGYECELETMALSGNTRQIYYGGSVPMIDVFFDKLDYCHEVSFDGRLELDPYSVSLADILLQKLQIVEINDKDLKDIEYLFVTCELGDDDDHKINQDYVAARFADDWGFWYTATQLNLERVKRALRHGACPHPRDARARQGAGRQAPGPRRGRTQDQEMAEAREEGRVEDLVQRGLLGLVRPGTQRDEQATERENVRHESTDENG